MAIKQGKQEVIRVRISSEQKEIFKNLAKEKNKTMSELICSYIDEAIEKEDLKKVEQAFNDKREFSIDDKLQKLKNKYWK